MTSALRRTLALRAGLVVAALASGAIGGCANIWGFEDSVLVDGGSQDATVPVDGGGGGADTGDAAPLACGNVVCSAGQRCVANACVCDSTSCPTGCCANGQCLSGTSQNACGIGGSACSACPGGQSCTGGACSGCSATCTNGCCTGATCNTPSATACGSGGGGCVSCTAAADGCTNGVCTCGGKAQCGAGQRCAGSQCVCDSTSCPTGCCDANHLCQQPSAASCSQGGGVACVNCFAQGGDTCNQGQCQCGSGGGGGPQTCSSGTACEDGGCVCNPTTCPTSCCDQGFNGQQCENQPDDNHCGTRGAQCVRCNDPTPHCSDGGCGP